MVSPSSTKLFALDASRRLHGRRAYDRVFGAKCRKLQGPLILWTAPNELDRPRLGFSVSRRAGTAVDRHRIKRLLREVFRLTQNQRQRGYDVIIVVRRHKPVALTEYQKWFAAAMDAADAEWTRRLN